MVESSTSSSARCATAPAPAPARARGAALTRGGGARFPSRESDPTRGFVVVVDARAARRIGSGARAEEESERVNLAARVPRIVLRARAVPARARRRHRGTRAPPRRRTPRWRGRGGSRRATAATRAGPRRKATRKGPRRPSRRPGSRAPSLSCAPPPRALRLSREGTPRRLPRDRTKNQQRCVACDRDTLAPPRGYPNRRESRVPLVRDRSERSQPRVSNARLGLRRSTRLGAHDRPRRRKPRRC